MSGDENEISIGSPLGIPLQILSALDRLPVLVHTQDCEVEVISWKSKIVGVAAEERHLLLGREYEPHIRVLLVAIQPVLATLIERNNVGTKTRFIQTFLLNLCLFRFARIERLLLGHAAFYRALNPR